MNSSINYYSKTISSNYINI